MIILSTSRRIHHPAFLPRTTSETELVPVVVFPEKSEIVAPCNNCGKNGVREVAEASAELTLAQKAATKT